MFIIFFVLDDPDRLDAVLEAWEEVGIRGVTVIESTGFHRLRRKFIPMRYTLGLTNDEEGHYTLIAIVRDELMARRCLQITEQLIGNLDEPHTGVFAAWPLAMVKGLPVEDEEA